MGYCVIKGSRCKYTTASGYCMFTCCKLYGSYVKGNAIPIEWLRERASRMLDFGEGIERIIKEWQDEQ